MHDWQHMNWGWERIFVQLLFLVIIVIVIIWAIRYFTGASQSNGTGSGGESALDILKKRYARGEINKEEFEQKKKDLL